MPLDSDLAPIYGPKTEHAAGMSRVTLNELLSFHKVALGRLEAIKDGCEQCVHKSGRVCKHWNATMPDGYDGRDCDAWQWDAIPW